MTSGRRVASAGQKGLPATSKGEGRGILGLPRVPVGQAIAVGVWTLEKPHTALFRPNAAPSSLPTVRASVVYRAGRPASEPLGTQNQLCANEPHVMGFIVMLVTEETATHSPWVPSRTGAKCARIWPTQKGLSHAPRAHCHHPLPSPSTSTSRQPACL